jgi:hypothetical protein
VVGCADGTSGGGTTQGPLATGGATSLYVVQQSPTGGQSYVLQYSATATGTVTPTATLLPASTFVPECVATDSVGEVYVGGYSGTNGLYEVLVYAAGASGPATPLRTITLPSSYSSASSYIDPTSLSVDAAGNLYVLGEDAVVAVYAANASGAATPSRLIAGSATGLLEPLGIAADALGNIYVSNVVPTGISSESGEILVFQTGSTGNVAPVRTITSPSIFYGVALDASGDLFTAEDTVTVSSSGQVTGTTGEIVAFAPLSNGAATPYRTIAGPATGITFGGGIRVDGAGNVYMLNDTVTASSTGNTATYTVLGFGPQASGDAEPAVDMGSSAWPNATSEIAVH